jgi:hypothetical protein
MRLLTFTLGVKKMEDRNRHNRIKISSLLFLRWRKATGNEWARASEIAWAAGTTSASMYVLLGRWTTWNLVDRLGSYPYRYMITKTGQRYLNNLAKWCPLDTTAIQYGGVTCGGHRDMMPCGISKHHSAPMTSTG